MNFSPFLCAFQEVIPALMNWKRFPSAWLTCAESAKKLATLWQPQLSEASSSELMPAGEDDDSLLLTGVQPGDYVDANK